MHVNLIIKKNIFLFIAILTNKREPIHYSYFLFIPDIMFIWLRKDFNRFVHFYISSFT